MIRHKNSVKKRIDAVFLGSAQTDPNADIKAFGEHNTASIILLAQNGYLEKKKTWKK